MAEMTPRGDVEQCCSCGLGVGLSLLLSGRLVRCYMFLYL